MSARAFQLALPMAGLHNTNHRDHWRVIARKRAGMREAAFYAAKTLDPIPGPVSLTVTFAFPDRRARDLDNYEIKGAIDGCVDAGLLSDDRSTILRSVTRKPADALSPKGYAVLVFAFEPVNEATGNGAPNGRIGGIGEGPRIAAETPLTTPTDRSRS